MCSPCRPVKPSEAIAAVASRFSQSAKAGSLQASATTLAPLRGPTLCLVGLDDGVDRRRIDQAFLREDGLERAHARGHRVEFVVVMVVVVVMIVCHVEELAPGRSKRNKAVIEAGSTAGLRTFPRRHRAAIVRRCGC